MLRKGSDADKMPELCVYGQHLKNMLFEVGPIKEGSKLAASEVQAWSQGTGTRLNHWEFGALLRLSGLVANCIREYEGVNMESPIRGKMRKDMVAAGVSKMLQSFSDG